MHFTWNRVKNQILGEFKSAPAEWFWLCGLIVISLSLPLTRAPSSYWSALSWRFTMSRSMTWWNRPLWPCTFGRTWRKVSLWIAWLRSQCPLPWKPMRSVSRQYVLNILYLQCIFTNSSSRGQKDLVVVLVLNRFKIIVKQNVIFSAKIGLSYFILC